MCGVFYDEYGLGGAGGRMSEKIKVFFVMIQHPEEGWMRVGVQHPTKDSAQSWLSFARAGWANWPGRVSQFTAEIVDGKLTERSRKILDQKYNMSTP